ncbi:unnamed protein product [Amoebophrya sp. A120]|nr:unnamed protein product [Amoebophrya sp. A120]|eukprot:GSA120T00019806001.1
MPTAKPRFARLDSDEEDVFVKKKDEDLENNSDNHSDSDSDSSDEESKSVSVSVAVKNKQPFHLLNSQKPKPALKKAALHQQPGVVTQQPQIFVKNSTASSSSGGSSSSSGSSAGSSSSSASSSSDEQSSSASSPGEQSHSVGEEGNDVLPEDEGCSSSTSEPRNSFDSNASSNKEQVDEKLRAARELELQAARRKSELNRRADQLEAALRSSLSNKVISSAILEKCLEQIRLNEEAMELISSDLLSQGDATVEMLKQVDGPLTEILALTETDFLFDEESTSRENNKDSHSVQQKMKQQTERFEAVLCNSSAVLAKYENFGRADELKAAILSATEHLLQVCEKAEMAKKAKEERKKVAATKIQAVLYRGAAARKKVAREKEAVLAIQKFWRAKLQKFHAIAQLVMQQQKVSVATKLQAIWRSKIVRRDYEDMRFAFDMAARDVQVFFRSRAFLQKIRKAVQEKKAATKIQTQFRGKTARKELADRLDAKKAREAEEAKKQKESDAAIWIQSKFRGVVTRLLVLPRLRAAKQKKLQDAKEAQAARVLQSCYRGKCARGTVAKLREEKAKLEQQALASVKIQSIYRGKKQRGETAVLQQQIAGARKVQQYWKNVTLVRKAFLDQRKATLQVQTQWRKMQAVKEVKEKRKELTDLVIPTTIRLQTAFRVLQAKKKFLQQKQSTVKAQSHIRKFLAGKKTEKPLALQKQLQAYFAMTEMDIWATADRSEFQRILEEYKSNEVHSVSIAEKASLFLQQWGEKIRLETDLATALEDMKNAEAVAGGNANGEEDSTSVREEGNAKQGLEIESLLEKFATLLSKAANFNANACDFQSLRIEDVEELEAQHAAACRRYEAGNTLALALKAAFPAWLIDIFQQCKNPEGDDDEKKTEDIVSATEKINFVQTSLLSQQSAEEEALDEASLVALTTAIESVDLSKQKREEAWTLLLHFVLMKANFGISELSDCLSALKSLASSTCSENDTNEPAEVADVLGKNEKLANFFKQLLFGSESTTAKATRFVKKLWRSVSPFKKQQSSASGTRNSSAAGEDAPLNVLREETRDSLKQLGRKVSELRFTLTEKAKRTASRNALQKFVNDVTLNTASFYDFQAAFDTHAPTLEMKYEASTSSSDDENNANATSSSNSAAAGVAPEQTNSLDSDSKMKDIELIENCKQLLQKLSGVLEIEEELEILLKQAVNKKKQKHEVLFPEFIEAFRTYAVVTSSSSTPSTSSSASSSASSGGGQEHLNVEAHAALTDDAHLEFEKFADPARLERMKNAIVEFEEEQTEKKRIMMKKKWDDNYICFEQDVAPIAAALNSKSKSGSKRRMTMAGFDVGAVALRETTAPTSARKALKSQSCLRIRMAYRRKKLSWDKRVLRFKSRVNRGKAVLKTGVNKCFEKLLFVASIAKEIAFVLLLVWFAYQQFFSIRTSSSPSRE